MRNIIIGLFLFLFCLSACSPPVKEPVALIPLPDSVRIESGSFPLERLKTIQMPDEWEKVGEAFAEDLRKQSDLSLSLSENIGDIRAEHNDEFPKEAYVLQIRKRQITIEAGDKAGVHHALATLQQLVLNASEGKLPCLTVQDQPRFGYRGVMLDCSRHFRTVDELKECIRQLSFFKLNVLHLHLTDNQGWRLALDKYPDLAQKGSYYEDFPELSGKYYTKAELKELVAYAEARGVEIIPEVDLPGHSLALLAGMPELSCRGGVFETYPEERYDGYFVFDADNLLDPHYVTEMNKVFSNGNQVVTGYRNTKNFGDNWITAGYGLWFLRESEYLNRPRDYLGTSCSVSGTGFLFAQDLLDELGGWEYFLLTEDLEFTADLVSRGVKIAYCGTAVAYDEQPTSFKQSIIQRSRWVKGYLQVVAKRGGSMTRRMLSEGSFGCFDMLMCTIPAVVITVISLVLNGIMLVVGVTSARQELGVFFMSLAMSAVNSYATMYLMGAMTLATEWKNIRCSKGKKIAYSFTFPFFVFSFGIAMLVAVFGNIEWKPIKHSVALSIGDMGSVSPQELRKFRKNRKL